MKIIVSNEAEAALVKNFLFAVHELCIVDLMEQEDCSSHPDEIFLNSEDYRILNETVFNEQPKIEIDPKEPELYFEETEFVQGTCVDCETITTGLSDPCNLTYADYLRMMTTEAMKTWRCESCQIKHRSKD